MTTEELGSLENVPMKDVWPHEAHDFTPWLARNIKQLGEALDMDLEAVRPEAPVGAFSLDILARDRSNGEAVAIENQVEWTDLSHLGQTLTYAGGYDARTLIWVAPRFWEEHRVALEWLNRWTLNEIRVFGIEVHTTKRDESEANLEFVPVAFPMDWSSSGEGKTRPVKLQSVRRPRFFHALINDLRKKGFESDDYAPPPLVHHHTLKSGISDINYSVMFENDGNAWVFIPGWPAINKLILSKLLEERKEIAKELEIGGNTGIEWKTPGYGSLGVYRKSTLYDSDEEIDEIRQWMFDYLLKFKKVFNPRMKNILAELETDDA